MRISVEFRRVLFRSLGAKNLKEAQKGLLYTGMLKIFVPFIIVLPGVIGYYYFGDTLYDSQDMVYPELVKKVLRSEEHTSELQSLMRISYAVFCLKKKKKKTK